MQTFYSNDVNKRKRPDDDVGDRGTGENGRARRGGGAGHAELEAHGYEVEPQETYDEKGYVISERIPKVRQPLFTYVPP